MMDVDALLTRIAYAGPRGADEATLRRLHRAFVMAVPFENLDLHLGRRIALDEAASFDKIVRQRRGGFCYELNGLFAALLRALGYDVTLLSARLATPDGGLGREFVHVLMMVRLRQRWLVDVGFGDWSAEPLRLDASEAQRVDDTDYRIVRAGDSYAVEQRDQNDAPPRSPDGPHWRQRYVFTLTPRTLADFVAMCDDLQTAPDSWFRQQRICTRKTADGRITLRQNELVISSADGRLSAPVDGDAAYLAALRDHFGIVLPNVRWRELERKVMP